MYLSILDLRCILFIYYDKYISLGDNVKYIDKDNNLILATILAKTANDKIVISLPGGLTIEVDSSEISSNLSI